MEAHSRHYLEDSGSVRSTADVVPLTSSYPDRIRHPQATVDAMRPHLAALGITRIADQTGLDRIGLPTFASFRPNALSLAVNQGKGLTRADAMASAIMEATEFSIAERPSADAHLASIDQLERSAMAYFLPLAQLPLDQQWNRSKPIRWLASRILPSHDSVLIPLDALSIDGQPTDLPDITQSTNGLASGNNSAEAIFHGLCETIERDAGTLWWLQSEVDWRRACLNPDEFDDAAVSELVRRIEKANLRIRLFNQTSDLNVPTMMALIGEDELPSGKQTDHAAGYGCHPIAARAALRAITEAAQTRITSIAGARDDIEASIYVCDADPVGTQLLTCEPAISPPIGAPGGLSLQEHIAVLLDAMQAHDAGPVMVTKLGGDAYGVSVVKITTPGLEDRESNRHWRPGQRALRVLLERS